MSSTSSGLTSISPWTASRINFLLPIPCISRPGLASHRKGTAKEYLCRAGGKPGILSFMAVDAITHMFYDFEIEPLSQGSPEEVHLVKIMSVDGRRFTYEVRGGLTEEAVVYLKSLIDAV